MRPDKTTEEQYNHLYDALDKARKGSEFVKVQRDALAALLIEHSELQMKAGEK